VIPLGLHQKVDRQHHCPPPALANLAHCHHETVFALIVSQISHKNSNGLQNCQVWFNCLAPERTFRHRLLKGSPPPDLERHKTTICVHFAFLFQQFFSLQCASFYSLWCTASLSCHYAYFCSCSECLCSHSSRLFSIVSFPGGLFAPLFCRFGVVWCFCSSLSLALCGWFVSLC